MMANQTAEKLRTLRLPAMAAEYLRQMESPVMTALDFDERVGMIVDAEWLSRENNRIDRRIKAANLRFSTACFADIDYRPSRDWDTRGQVPCVALFDWGVSFRGSSFLKRGTRGLVLLAALFDAVSLADG